MTDPSISILIEHPWFLVVNKPAGIQTQAVVGIPSVQSLLIEQLRSHGENNATPFIGVPHRLDRGTTGALVVARNQRALKRLCSQFAARTVVKIYHAVVEGCPTEPDGRWTDTMRKIPDVAQAELVPEDHPDARPATLSYRVLETGKNASEVVVSLIEIELETGRMHQIRLQFGSRGYPVLGDTLYGSQVQLLPSDSPERERPIALHAQRLEFRNPQNAEKVAAVAPYPSDWVFPNQD